jgi:hypothetical protein
MAEDDWLDSLRAKPEFKDLLSKVRIGHEQAKATFDRLNGTGQLKSEI